MPSLPKTCTTSSKLFPARLPSLPLVALHLLFFPLLLLSLLPPVNGAALRQHKLQGSESDTSSLRGSVHQAPPNVDMLKALEYIESLRQRTNANSQRPLLADTGDDAEKLRQILRLASSDPAQSKDEEEEGREDKSEELLQAVLSTLRQTEETPKPEPQGEGALYPRVQQQQKQQQQQHSSIRLHKKLPLLFEDEEEDSDDDEGEGGEEEEEDNREHFKRTNENVEEKYTPQNLATLQSVFDELDKLTSPKSVHKRQDEEEEDVEDERDGDEEEEDDMFNVRNVDYDDVFGDLGLDWGPPPEMEEGEEEEERGNNKQHRALDFIDDDDDNDEEGEEDEGEEEDDESYPVKRSNDPDDAANLVDYYLLKVLEKTEEEEQKREIEEEEEEEKERTERRVSQSPYRDDLIPRTIYEFIQISQKLQIPPEDLLDMLRTGELARNLDQSRKINKLSRAQNKQVSQISPKKMTHKFPIEAGFYSRRLPERQKTPEELRTEEILNILGLGPVDTVDHRAPARKQQKLFSNLSRLHGLPAGRSRESARHRLPSFTLRDDYDDTTASDEDELAEYLAAQMSPAQYQNRKAAGQKRDEAGQGASSFEQAIQDYFGHMDSDKSLKDEKRQSETDGESSFENEAVMKLLSYLNPETEDSAADGKTV